MHNYCCYLFPLVPSQSPQNVTIHNLTSTSLVLTWDPVPLELANGVIQGYRVRVWRQADGMTPGTMNVTMINITIAVIGALQSNTRHVVQVSAYTSAGEGNSTSVLVTTTHQGGNLQLNAVKPKLM